jgi:hypothetical protein
MTPSLRSTIVLATFTLAVAACANTTPNAAPGIPEASNMQASSSVTGRISWVRPGTDFRKYTSVMIAPVSIYDGTDTDWGNTAPADRTEIANYLQSAYTKAIGQNLRVVNRPGPNTLLLKMELVGVQSNVPVAATVSRVYPAGLVANIFNQSTDKPGTFSGSVTYAMSLFDSTSNTLLAAAINKKFPEALDITSTLSTNAAAKAGIDQGAAQVAKTIQLLRSGQARTGS